MSRIVRQNYPGQVRAIALDDDDCPFSVFEWRHPKLDPRVKYDEVYAGVVTKHAADLKGCFAAVTGAEGDVFCQLGGKASMPNEGEHVHIRIKTESWGNKSAIGRLTDSSVEVIDVEQKFADWCGNVRAAWDRASQVEGETDQIEEIFDDLCSNEITVPAGGRITIESTKALIAIDIDSSGSRLAADKYRMNEGALTEIARQISLRRLGGVIVIDLVGVVSDTQHKDLKNDFTKTYHAFDARPLQILPRNAFGLFEMSLPRRERPFDRTDEISIYDRIAGFWRFAFNGLRQDRAAIITFRAGSKLYSAIQTSEYDAHADLSDEFGKRFHILKDDELPAWDYVMSYDEN